jgi:hypothetical protein
LKSRAHIAVDTTGLRPKFNICKTLLHASDGRFKKGIYWFKTINLHLIISDQSREKPIFKEKKSINPVYHYGYHGLVIDPPNTGSSESENSLYLQKPFVDRLRGACGWIIIMYSDETYNIASGFKVSPRHVLTAYHNTSESPKGCVPIGYWFSDKNRVPLKEGTIMYTWYF